jgi:hypothetical protein
VTQTCNATVQAIGACSPADAGESGVILAYWVSTVDDDPSPEVQSDAVDFRDATCWQMGLAPEDCTKEKADGYWRRLMVDTTRAYRKAQREGTLAAPPDPTMDGQNNP